MYRELGTETPWTLSIGIPDSSYSCTPVPATRGYGSALYHFSMNHRQRSLQTETGPNVTQFLQVSITLHCFLGAPSVLRNTGSEGGAQSHRQKKKRKRKLGRRGGGTKRRAKYMCQGLWEQNKSGFLFQWSSLFLCQQPPRLLSITHN